MFVESVLDAAGAGCHMAAILPDVLRTGSRYERWRRMIELRSRVSSIKPLGLFDEHTDVDVFLLVAEPFGATFEINGQGAFAPNVAWWNSPHTCSRETVGDHFSVMVGPVVDNRDPREGPEHPFVIARDLPRQGTAGLPARTRPFSGRLFAPPFVLLRRTSRPSVNGEVRAPGVLIDGERMAAIDNHLLVARPFDGQISTCRKLLAILEDVQTTRFLDQRMRCRHLTVKAVRELSWIPQ